MKIFHTCLVALAALANLVVSQGATNGADLFHHAARDIGGFYCKVPSKLSDKEYGAKEGTINKGIKYLRKLDGECHLTDSDKPSRISCSNNGGIWIITKGKGKGKNVPWSVIADHAQHLVDHCSKLFNKVYWVVGTTEDKDGWFQVIVGDTYMYGQIC
ncbi:hypothetical protein MKZ38_003072 [Zalerion maritima]|uniref:Uncharacterized protein n=1 Tax=Zalerion maritima TaxID=339359 RepID=A0AAD5WQE5_9PEZI|nr:hypothetical protein MKZ38_003072 [Zalerion maritima]